jgi:hypothetical protein
MRAFSSICVSLLLLTYYAKADETDSETAPTPQGLGVHQPIATSNGIEIVSLRTVRRVSADGGKDTSGIELGLWLTRSVEKDSGSYALQLLSLEPIEDNLGTQLLTESRRNAIPSLAHMVNTSQRKTIGDRSGPSLSIVLDAPERQATSIKLLKGTAKISTLEFAKLKFEDLTAIEGKRLEDEKLESFPIVPAVKFEDEQTTLSLRVPMEHALIADWGLGQKGQLLYPRSKTAVRVDESVLLTKSYKGDRTKESFLGIMLADPIETTTYDFEFTDVPLP